MGLLIQPLSHDILFLTWSLAEDNAWLCTQLRADFQSHLLWSCRAPLCRVSKCVVDTWKITLNCPVPLWTGLAPFSWQEPHPHGSLSAPMGLWKVKTWVCLPAATLPVPASVPHPWKAWEQCARTARPRRKVPLGPLGLICVMGLNHGGVLGQGRSSCQCLLPRGLKSTSPALLPTIPARTR